MQRQRAQQPQIPMIQLPESRQGSRLTFMVRSQILTYQLELISDELQPILINKEYLQQATRLKLQQYLMCLIADCKEKHQHHYCKVCHDSNSNHFSSNCKKGAKQKGCKAHGCHEHHAAHFCKICHNPDSNHRSADCPKKARCKAKGCEENHKEHYCSVCHTSNSHHMSVHCPKGITIYHGSKGENLASIMKNGLRPCIGGRIGDGIYFTKKEFAGIIADHRTQGNGEIIVLECRVNESECKKGDHPPWAGINHDFPEWCLTTNGYRILGAYLGGITGKYVSLLFNK